MDGLGRGGGADNPVNEGGKREEERESGIGSILGRSRAPRLPAE